MNNSFLVMGTGEVGLSMLERLHEQRNKMESDFTVAALVQPDATAIYNADGEAVLPQTKQEPIDLVASSINQLAEVFSRYQTVICCSGFSIGKGMQVKITEAVLKAGVERYIPWQFGADYDKIGRGSAQPVFDEQLDVRDLLRSQEKTKWMIVSTGMITSFLFREDFGVVSLCNKTISALASWENALTLTSCEDIGKITVSALFHQPKLINQVVYAAGETATFAQIADYLGEIFGTPFHRELLTEDYLRSAVQNDPENNFHKYRLVFTDPGVSWPMEHTFNYRENIPTVGIVEWAKINLLID